MVRPSDLVHEHKLVSEKEAKLIGKTYGVSIDMFPSIYESDPQAKLINAKPGQLIEINGPDSKKPYYRYVIKG